jgi:uncharacterized SAM-binding protein YcdF (DUF218 family)
MTDILQLTGVPPDAIILEGNSTNTYENAVETAQILDEMEIDEIILITSAIHMPRSLGIFSRFDLKITPAPTDFLITELDIAYMLSPDPRIQLLNLLPAAHNLYNLTHALKEYIGIAIYRMRGWM